MIRFIAITFAVFLNLGHLSAQQILLPIIDMHLHAIPAGQNGPPPTAICAPPIEWPTHDPSGPWTIRNHDISESIFRGTIVV